MALRYGLTIHELMDFFSEEHKGFTEQEIQKAEQTIGVSLPVIYKDFLLKYGKDDINGGQNRILSPNRIFTSYFAIQELLDTALHQDFEKAIQKGTQQEKYAENPYFALWQLPKEQWNTITQNYVLIWCENQGIWYAGYWFQDLLEGEENPPIYMGINDDIIEFKKTADNLEQFLTAMTLDAAYFYIDEFTNQRDIAAILSYANIDLEQLKASGEIGICLDTADGILYYLIQNTSQEFLIENTFQKLLCLRKKDMDEE